MKNQYYHHITMSQFSLLVFKVINSDWDFRILHGRANLIRNKLPFEGNYYSELAVADFQFELKA